MPDIDKLSLEDARKLLRVIEQDYVSARNELCLKCGNYTTAYKGSCDGCKYYKNWEHFK